MATATQRQAALHGVCIHCEEEIHAGRRGWLCLLDDDFADRYFCSSSPDGTHAPLTTSDALTGVERIMISLGGEVPIRTVERTTCDRCGQSVAWNQRAKAWWNSSSNPFCEDFSRHTPSMSFITDSLKAMKDALS